MCPFCRGVVFEAPMPAMFRIFSSLWLRGTYQDLEQKYRDRIEELEAALATARDTIEAQQNHMAELIRGGKLLDVISCVLTYIYIQ